MQANELSSLKEEYACNVVLPFLFTGKNLKISWDLIHNRFLLISLIIIIIIFLFFWCCIHSAVACTTGNMSILRFADTVIWLCFLVSNVGGYKEEIVLTIYRLLSFQAISIVNIWESLKQGKFHNYVYSIHTLLLYRVHTPFNKVTIIIKMYQLKAFIWVVTLYYETVKSHRWSGPPPPRR